MRVLWVGDAGVATGFARCTHAACDALHAAGHEVEVLGVNHWGDPDHGYPYRLWTCQNPWDGGRDALGQSRLSRLIERLEPEVVVLLTDPWHVRGYVEHWRGFRDARAEQGVEMREPLWVGWLAVDGANQQALALNDLDHVVTWTEFGLRELEEGGYLGSGSVVPLGVDGQLFRPLDREACRKSTCDVPEGSFIVGVVGRNQPRKRLDLTVEYFAHWVNSRAVEDAYLYLHIAPTGESGYDYRSLARYWKLPKGRLILSEPPTGHGQADAMMPLLYNTFDAYLTTSQGEGWGLPALEAMACGVPCILPDFAAFGREGGWVKDAAEQVPCRVRVATAPWDGMLHTIGALPDRDATCEALDRLYVARVHREALTKRSLKLAAEFTWERTGAEFRSVLEQVYGRAQAVAATAATEPEEPATAVSA